MTTFNEFMEKMLTAFPNAQVGEDNDGQLIIYTDLQRKTTEGYNDIVVPFEPEDDDNEFGEYGANA